MFLSPVCPWCWEMWVIPFLDKTTRLTGTPWLEPLITHHQHHPASEYWSWSCWRVDTWSLWCGGSWTCPPPGAGCHRQGWRRASQRCLFDCETPQQSNADSCWRMRNISIKSGNKITRILLGINFTGQLILVILDGSFFVFCLKNSLSKLVEDKILLSCGVVTKLFKLVLNDSILKQIF